MVQCLRSYLVTDLYECIRFLKISFYLKMLKLGMRLKVEEAGKNASRNDSLSKRSLLFEMLHSSHISEWLSTNSSDKSVWHILQCC